MPDESAPIADPPRRQFLRSALAVLVGGVVAVVPLAAGLLVYLDPLRRRQKSSGGGQSEGGFIPVTPLSGLPPDDKPRKFEVITDKVDAWTKTPNVAVGAVFLKRDAKDVVTAWNVVCPHAGCFIDVAGDGQSFRCPCHNSSFHPDGRTVAGRCVSPRGMDRLEVDVAGLSAGQVRVKFQNFVAGTHDKRPVT
jgi:menaquinol-cytochrome c reductase iron-sulfur subunit